MRWEIWPNGTVILLPWHTAKVTTSWLADNSEITLRYIHGFRLAIEAYIYSLAVGCNVCIATLHSFSKMSNKERSLSVISVFS